MASRGGSGTEGERALTAVGAALVCLVGALVAAEIAPAKYPGPNGEIAFGRLGGAVDGYRVFAADSEGKHERRLVHGDAESPIWSPDGAKVLVSLSRAGREVPATLNRDGSGLEPLGSPTETEMVCSAWSPDGARLLCDRHSEDHPQLNGLYTVRASDGGGLTRLTDNPFDEADIAGDFSPDGEQIAFTRQRPGRSRPRGALFVADADGTELRQITPFGMPDHDEVPKWSPDGTRILFGSVAEKLLVVRPDGTGLRKISPRTLGKRGIMRLERKLLNQCRDESAKNKRCKEKARKRAKRRTTGIGFDPGWSPDGERIVFSFRRRPRGRVDIYTARPDGTHLVQVTDTRAFETFSDWGPAPRA